MKKAILSLAFLSITVCLIWSCISSKKDLPEPDVDLSPEQNYVTILSDLNTIQASVDAGYLGNTNGCGSYTMNYDTAGGNYGKFTIDFTSASCSDTITRSGQIEVYHIGSYSQRTLRDSVSYFVSISGRNITGYRIRTSILTDSVPGIKSFSIHDTLITTFPSGKQYALIANTTRTDDSTNNSTAIYGSSTGRIINGDQFSATINAPSPTTTSPTHLTSFPLKFDWTCAYPFRYPVSGALAFTNTTQNITRTINFEQGIQQEDLNHKKTIVWLADSCGRDIATFVNPLGNIYYFTVK